jgi:type III secretion protein O
MAYILQDLLDIREMRDDSASQKLKREQNRYEQALREIEECKRELERYIEWRKGEEDGRYEGMMRKKLLVRRLEELRTEITLLREGDLVKQKKILDAESAADKARADLDAARLARQMAQKDLQKIEEHRDIWVEDWLKEQNLLMDREAEELVRQKLDFGDDEDDEYEVAEEP